MLLAEQFRTRVTEAFNSGAATVDLLPMVFVRAAAAVLAPRRGPATRRATWRGCVSSTVKTGFRPRSRACLGRAGRLVA